MNSKEIMLFKDEIIKICEKSKIFFTKSELENMEITDFGLEDFKNIGLSIIIYVNTMRVCAKELIMIPNQICPQHIHPNIKDIEGKEETFRCRWGKVYLYISGEKQKDIKAKIPEKYKDKFDVFDEIILKPGDQYTLKQQTWHWFQSGPAGAVISEFSTHSFDAGDIFFDKNIFRKALDN
ncbi:MAG: D-lyxose/D-mannose family sugar isomerase [Actinobacteria bacterium]|nr:D-lyxose/D-mannose family sugar isomerase [Actinomycetota bacterium]